MSDLNLNRDSSFLWDMLEASRSVLEFVRDRAFEDYLNDKFLRSAVERQIEIIGEAARHVSDEYRQLHVEIPWRQIMAQRNVLAHDYGDLKHDRIWRVATIHVGELIGLLEPLVPPSPAPCDPQA